MKPAPLTLGELLRQSPSMASSLAGVERAARSDSPILILGEPGTGRSTLARAVHAASPRSSGPLAEVDPAVIPSTLFESEFFGYRAGAFSGAAHTTPGRVARAEGGTLLLDHIEELPLAAQPKLLRLLAERRYIPLGGTEVECDVRFVAIGSEELAERISQGAFREDLYYRLEVLAFRLPPLRRRLDDLPRLVDSLFSDLADRFGKTRAQLSPEAREQLLDYHWPGNLRQLRNVLERALILGGDGPISPRLPDDPALARPSTLQELEKQHIRRALAYTRGHQGQAAELLGISRKALWEKRRRYGIP